MHVIFAHRRDRGLLCRRRRTPTAYTQEAAQSLTGIKLRTTVADANKGVPPALYTLVRLAHFFDLSTQIDWFFAGVLRMGFGREKTGSCASN